MKRKSHVPVKKKARKKPPEEAPSSGAPVAPGEAGAPKAPLISPSKPKQMVQGVRDDGAVPDEILAELKGTKPWITFFAVLQFLGALGCLALTGITLFTMVMSAQGPAATGGGASVSSSTLALVVLAVTYLIGMLVYISLGLRMIQFCKSVDRVRYSGDPKDLEYVLGFLRGVWQVIGAMLLVGIIMIAVFALVSPTS